MPQSSSPGKRGVKIIHVGTSDWDDATARMTCEEEGAFWRVIRLMYRQGGPIRDDDRLPHALRIDPRSWRRLRSALQRHEVLEWIGGWITSKRVQKELGKVAEQREQASTSGKKGNLKRWGQPGDKPVDDFGLQPELPFAASQLDPDCDLNATAMRSKIFDNPLKNNDPVIATPSPTPINIKKGREALSKGEGEKVPEAGTNTPQPTRLVDGQIILDPANRARWLPHFANNETALDLGLEQAAGWITNIERLSPAALHRQVNAQLASQALARLGKASKPQPTQNYVQRAALDADRRMTDAVARVIAKSRPRVTQ